MIEGLVPRRGTTTNDRRAVSPAALRELIKLVFYRSVRADQNTQRVRLTGP